MERADFNDIAFSLDSEGMPDLDPPNLNPFEIARHEAVKQFLIDVQVDLIDVLSGRSQRNYGIVSVQSSLEGEFQGVAIAIDLLRLETISRQEFNIIATILECIKILRSGQEKPEDVRFLGDWLSSIKALDD
jgi:hypothetical protein